jgi:HAMP domain-containing protein
MTIAIVGTAILAALVFVLGFNVSRPLTRRARC